MRITLKLYGNLKHYSPRKEEIANADVAEGTTIAALLAQLSVPDSHVWMSAVNDTVVDHSTMLRDGDVLEVFEPVGGGASSRLQVSGHNKIETCGFYLPNRPN